MRALEKRRFNHLSIAVSSWPRGFFALPAWLAGIIYSLVLFALGQVLLRAAGSPLLELSTLSLVLAHVVYGLVLGLLTR